MKTIRLARPGDVDALLAIYALCRWRRRRRRRRERELDKTRVDDL